MTYKYREVRREVYNRCSGKAPKKYRSFSRMKKLFKKKLLGSVACDGWFRNSIFPPYGFCP